MTQPAGTIWDSGVGACFTGEALPVGPGSVVCMIGACLASQWDFAPSW